MPLGGRSLPPPPMAPAAFMGFGAQLPAVPGTAAYGYMQQQPGGQYEHIPGFVAVKGFTIFDDAGAIVKNGRVVLFGFVTQPHKKERLEERMHEVLGIIEFRNEIVVLPNSMNDNNLRRTLATRLYRDSLFSNFATMALPPINIIVQNSRVLLTGIVHNQLAKTKAEHILRSTPGILGFESRLRIDK